MFSPLPKLPSTTSTSGFRELFSTATPTCTTNVGSRFTMSSTASSSVALTASTPVAMSVTPVSASAGNYTLPPVRLTQPASQLPTPPVLDIAAVGIKLPDFWPGDSELWFAQAEAQFSIRRITDERTKYSHVVATLGKEYATDVRDLLLQPPTTQPYSTLKEALIRSQRRLG